VVDCFSNFQGESAKFAKKVFSYFVTNTEDITHRPQSSAQDAGQHLLKRVVSVAAFLVKQSIRSKALTSAHMKRLFRRR